MNLILIGPRGVGKSKVSRSLSKLLQFPVVSTDSVAVYEEGGLSIPEIVNKHGWKHFRELEYQILKKLEYAHNLILDCGGGILFDLAEDETEIISQRKLHLLRKIGKIILLERDFDELVGKVIGDKTRPDLSNKKAYSEILTKRLPLYREAAHHICQADGKSKEEIAKEIKKLLLL
ncbi:shikimate kinase [Leptospira ryugenii]|uniref:Shikimate kinase n=1 Tax=Leptospira ryugenii TaxID=1917863 RepID=A0A2P2E4R0_9LEPT|nr:shikimate kinase [Leptospira ryugenii]GBF51867.1 shikimate kinase [Leptospira ryugenii]